MLALKIWSIFPVPSSVLVYKLHIKILHLNSYHQLPHPPRVLSRAHVPCPFPRYKLVTKLKVWLTEEEYKGKHPEVPRFYWCLSSAGHDLGGAKAVKGRFFSIKFLTQEWGAQGGGHSCHSSFRSSTSKMRVAFGGMMPGCPVAP